VLPWKHPFKQEALRRVREQMVHFQPTLSQQHSRRTCSPVAPIERGLSAKTRLMTAFQALLTHSSSMTGIWEWKAGMTPTIAAAQPAEVNINPASSARPWFQLTLLRVHTIYCGLCRPLIPAECAHPCASWPLQSTFPVAALNVLQRNLTDGDIPEVLV